MSEHQARQGLPVPSADEVRHELASIVEELVEHYAGRADEPTVSRTVYGTYERLAAGATVVQHLVPLTRNESRDELDRRFPSH